MSARSDEISSLDSRMSSLMSEEQDVEKVVCDTEDRAMREVELFLPCTQV